MNRRVKILYTTPILHYPSISGPHLHIDNSLKALSRVADVYLYCRISKDEIGGNKAAEYYKKYCKKIFFSPLSRIFPTNIANLFLEKTVGKKYFAPHSESLRIYRDIATKAKEYNIDFFWLGFGNISYPLLKFLRENSTYKIILQTDSIWSRYLLRGLPYAKSVNQRLRIKKAGNGKQQEEKWGTKLANITTAVSEIDAYYYRQFVQDAKRVKIFPNVVDLNEYKHIDSKIKKPAILISGTFWRGSPMEDGTKWFLKRIWPSIQNEVGEINLYIVGQSSDKIFRGIKDKNIFIQGRVESMLPYLFGSEVAAVPLRFESGTRFKILEAGACRLPVVSTKLGAEGLSIKDNFDILLADQPKKFAKQIIKLINNKRRAFLIGKNLNSLVKKTYSIEVLANRAKSILGAI